jgi:phosphoesterase RecJ-like protein
MKPVSEIYSLLQQPAKVVITMHQKPDADAMGSALALYHFLLKLGHEATVISPTNWASWVEWMPGCKTVINFENHRYGTEKILNEADYLFCLDFNIFHRTKQLAPKLKEANCIKILIDHHEEPDLDSFNYVISNAAKSSTCEMIYDLIVASGNEHLIDTDIAECIYAGVISDTGSFRFTSTTASVHELVAKLKRSTGFDHTKVYDKLFDNFMENRIRFIGHVLSHNLEFLYEYNTALVYVSKKDLIKYEIKTGDTEGIVNLPQAVQDIKLVGMVVDRDGERKWSFRSKGQFDCNTFARKYFNGGGHFNASGGNTTDSLQETVEKFKLILQENKHLLQ